MNTVGLLITCLSLLTGRWSACGGPLCCKGPSYGALLSEVTVPGKVPRLSALHARGYCQPTASWLRTRPCGLTALNQGSSRPWQDNIRITKESQRMIRVTWSKVAAVALALLVAPLMTSAA